MSSAIEFENVSKQYRLGLVSTGTIAHDLNRWWTMNILRKEDPYLKIGETNDRSHKGHSDYVWALKDINFKVEQGDVVGIIGKNGAGKSTLLKLLSRVTTPTTGSIKVRGRIASLLEVGTGFHPEMTGRENIFMNGAIMGMTRQEVGRKLDEIIDFSGCERYIDTPVKRYSSGMTVRLGFAVAAHLDPEILVVDEVLAVGDAEFQKKAIGKMQDISHGGGRTVLFVSHNMDSVRSLCKSGIILKNGQVDFVGTAVECVDNYLESNVDLINIPIVEVTREPGITGVAKVTDLQYLDPITNQRVFPYCGRDLKIRIVFDLNSIDGISHNNCTFSIGIDDSDNHRLLSFSSTMKYSRFKMAGGHHYADLIIPRLPLTPGIYKIGFYIGTNGRAADWVKQRIPMEILDDDYFRHGGKSASAHLSGHVVLADHEWRLDNMELDF